MVYDRAAQVDFVVSDCSPLPDRTRILLVTPDHFQVDYVINPHMAGNLGSVDTAEAAGQWEALRAAYVELGLEVAVLPGAPGLPDMVFCANQSLTIPPDASGRAGVLMSNMASIRRAPEVPLIAGHFASLGYAVRFLPETVSHSFEGMGDALWHTGRRLLWGGYGPRTDRGVYGHLAETLPTRVVALKLEDPDFYHLDTCLSVLDEHTALIFPGAFDEEGRALIGRLFERVIEAPEHEARRLFACNAHCPDGRHVLIQPGCTATESALRTAGFEPIPIETGEFLKSGGSVFCMKLHHW